MGRKHKHILSKGSVILTKFTSRVRILVRVGFGVCFRVQAVDPMSRSHIQQINRFTNVVFFPRDMVTSYSFNMWHIKTSQCVQSSLHTSVVLGRANFGQAFTMLRTTFVKRVYITFEYVGKPVYNW